MSSASGWSLTEIIRIFQEDFTDAVVAAIEGSIAPIEMAPLPPSSFAFQSLKLDGSGSPDMNVDGSATPQVFEWEVPPPRAAKVERLNIYLQDRNVRPDLFGGLPALTNGILVEAVDETGTGVLMDFCDGEAIKRHNEFGILAGVDVFTTTGAGSDDVVLIRWTIARAGAPLKLDPGQRLRLTIRDDLTGLSRFQGLVSSVFE